MTPVVTSGSDSRHFFLQRVSEMQGGSSRASRASPSRGTRPACPSAASPGGSRSCAAACRSQWAARPLKMAHHTVVASCAPPAPSTKHQAPASRPPRLARGAPRAGARTYFLPRQKGHCRGPEGGKTARTPIKQGIGGFSAPQKPGKTFFKNFSKPYCAQRHDVILLRRLKDQIRFTEGL